MPGLFKSEKFVIVSLFSLAALTAACNTPNTTVNTNQNLPTTNVNANSANATYVNSANSAPVESVVIETREPEQYQTNVNLKLEASGTEKTTSLPTLSALVAKMGSNRRMEFSMPNNEKLIYLEVGGKQFIVSPNRQQYAELTKESTGFEMRRLLMPGEIVSRLKNVKGVQRAGEEQYGGRTAVKYSYNTVTDTKSQAGNVETQLVVLVDKETGLPVRSETNLESQNASVQGVQNMRLVTEMTNLNANVDAASFAEPTNLKKVAPEEVRQQINLIFGAMTAFLGQMVQNQQSGSQPTNNQPMSASPSPTATARP